LKPLFFSERAISGLVRLMLKSRFIVTIFLYLPFLSSGQSYITTAGFRMGNEIGLSVSQRIFEKKTIDLYHAPALFSERSTSGLMMKQHYSILTKRLNFFGGGGIFYQMKNGYSTNDEPAPDQYAAGLLFTAGLDFTIGKMNIGYDIMPLYRISGNDNGRRFFSSSAISLRYVIVPQKSKTKKWFKRWKN
jgi:Tfp pilus assembly protein PilZ